MMCEEAVSRQLHTKWAEAGTEGMRFYSLNCINIEIFIASKILLY